MAKRLLPRRLPRLGRRLRLFSGRRLRRAARWTGLAALAAIVAIQADPTGQLLLALTCAALGAAAEYLWLSRRRRRPRRK